MNKRIAAGLVALLSLLGILFVASPAQAWSYCNSSINAGKMNLWTGQGYCGQRKWIITTPTIGLGDSPVCMRLDNQGNPGSIANWAGSADNDTSLNAKFYPALDCSGQPQMTLRPKTSHPDFTVFTYDGVWLYHNASSILWYR